MMDSIEKKALSQQIEQLLIAYRGIQKNPILPYRKHMMVTNIIWLLRNSHLSIQDAETYLQEFCKYHLREIEFLRNTKFSIKFSFFCIQEEKEDVEDLIAHFLIPWESLSAESNISRSSHREISESTNTWKAGEVTLLCFGEHFWQLYRRETLPEVVQWIQREYPKRNIILTMLQDGALPEELSSCMVLPMNRGKTFNSFHSKYKDIIIELKAWFKTKFL